MTDELSLELHKAKIEILRLKRHTLALENETMRLKIQTNAQIRRNLKNEIKRLHAELNPPLPF